MSERAGPTLAGLPPAQARTCLAVRRFCLEQARATGLAIRETSILAAFSGGPDSLALVLVLSALARNLGLTLHAAHLDHGLRPESADEARQAARLCAALGVPFSSRAVRVGEAAAELGLGIEETARRLRYEFLEAERARLGFDLVATGHTADDLATDQFLRLSRGCGWPALGGMPAFDPGRLLVRPLLLTPRSALLPLVGQAGLQPVADPSNQDPRFARNRMRWEVLPLFERENPSYLRQACQLWRQSRDAALSLAQRAHAVIEEHGTGFVLPRAALNALEPGQRAEALLEALRRLHASQGAGSAIPRILDCLAAGQFPREVSLRGAKILVNGQGLLVRPKLPGER